MDLCYCLWSSVLFVILENVSLELFMAFLVLFYVMNELRIVTLAWENIQAHEMLQQIKLLFRIWHSIMKLDLHKTILKAKLNWNDYNFAEIHQVYDWNFSHLIKFEKRLFMGWTKVSIKSHSYFPSSYSAP